MQNPFIKSLVGALLRHGVSALGSVVTSNGLASNDDTQAAVGAIIFVGGYIWSAYQKYQADQKLKAAIAAPAGSDGSTPQATSRPFSQKNGNGFVEARGLVLLGICMVYAILASVIQGCSDPMPTATGAKANVVIQAIGKAAVSSYGLQAEGGAAAAAIIQTSKNKSAAAQDVLAGCSAGLTMLNGQVPSLDQAKDVFASFKSDKTSANYPAVSLQIITALLPVLNKFPEPDKAKNFLYGMQLSASIQLALQSAASPVADSPSLVIDFSTAPVVGRLRVSNNGGLKTPFL